MTNLSKEQLMELDKKHFLHPTSNIKQQQEDGPPIIFKKGEGIYLEDIDGKKYIEGMSSLWNVNVGYGRKELAEVAKDQITELPFSSAFSNYSHEPVIKLSAKIAELTPGDLNTVFFTSGGSESNDSAIKIARHYWNIQGKPERRKIISRKKAYHGVALGATSATGIPEFWKFASVSPEFFHAETTSSDEIRGIIEKEGPETIAAFMAEPVVGAGGIIIPPENYFKEVRAICDEYDILFIADEVITGFGRTGKWFGIENWGVVPDMMTIAKGVSSGYIPLGGVVLSEKIHQTLAEKTEGTMFHGFTYSGHPVATAVALKNIEIIEDENLVENARAMGEELINGFKQLENEVPVLGNGRTVGLLAAIEVYKDAKTGERFETKIAPQVVAEAVKRGLICRSVIYNEADTVVLAPPLIINKEQIKDMLNILKESVEAAVAVTN
ncbi:aminotransferase family protein [Virgibacillus sp. W0181]|uniref:aminotransferase family protein n=1 Tax=Virgibacillus sp. W0181 TaxID=3391581 RepID=UPI003F4648D7